VNPEIAVYEALAKEILRRCMAEDSPVELHAWLTDKVQRLGGGGDASALMTWAESFEYTDAMLVRFAANAALPPEQRKELTWPWSSWNAKITKLGPGMLGVVAAPDGSGKTMYGEAIIEHWASHKSKTVFVHYELNRQLMMLRRLARHTSIDSRTIEEWTVTPAQAALLRTVRPRLESWDGDISYLHTAEWSMERTCAELRKLRAEGVCDVVVVDYLEKASTSNRQLKIFGTSIFAREADNVEQLKNFAETTGTPVLMIAQMNKSGKALDFKDLDRGAMRGAGEKSEKANLVVLLNREHTEDGYSNTVNVMIDKQTMGPTGSLRQYMRPEFFQVADIAN
jgi:replicative DNA helicase